MGRIAVIWGVGGLVALLIEAVVRLARLGVQAYAHPMEPVHWAFLAVWVPFMAWSEGYRGFHLSFSPMFAARARYLRDHPRPLHVVLAPFFCLGLIHATRVRFVRSTILTLGIVVIVLLVRLLDQPWRGIIDLGVILGLSIGTVSLLYYCLIALRSDTFDHDPEVPEVPKG